MFEQLTHKINLQNMAKLRMQDKKSRYANDNEQQSSLAKHKEHQDSQLDDLEVQLQEREQNFRKIEQMQQQEQAKLIIKRDSTMPPNLFRKLNNQIQLLKHELTLQQRDHDRRVEYEQQLHKRRQQWLNVQISKLKHIVRKYKNEENQVRQLRKDRDNYQKIKDGLEKRIQCLEEDNRKLRSQLQRVMYDNNKEQHQKAKQIDMNSDDVEKIRKLESRIKQLEDDHQYQKRINQQRRKKIEKLNLELQSLKQKMIHQDQQYEQNLRNTSQTHYKRQEQIRQQIQQLKKRNQQLEQAFIDKISEMTRLQANILSSSSNLNSQLLSVGVFKHSHQEESLNLHDQSPIKPVLHRPQTDKKPYNQKKSFPDLNRKREDNPEHSQSKFKQEEIKIDKNKESSEQCTCCHNKIEKYRVKLEQANRKIVDLIQQKMECMRRSSSKERAKHLSTTTADCAREISYARTRVLSWNRNPMC